MRLSGKTALITGAARGIGLTIARAYAAEGAQVAIVYLAEHEDAEDTKRCVEAEGADCLLLPGDVGDSKFCKEAVRRTIERFDSSHRRCGGGPNRRRLVGGVGIFSFPLTPAPGGCGRGAHRSRTAATSQRCSAGGRTRRRRGSCRAGDIARRERRVCVCVEEPRGSV